MPTKIEQKKYVLGNIPDLLAGDAAGGPGTASGGREAETFYFSSGGPGDKTTSIGVAPEQAKSPKPPSQGMTSILQLFSFVIKENTFSLPCSVTGFLF